MHWLHHGNPVRLKRHKVHGMLLFSSYDSRIVDVFNKDELDNQ